MRTAILVVALLAAAPLTGCIGGDDGTPEKLLKNRATVSDTAGGIEGLVTDPAVQPVEGALVTVVESGATGRTASDGSYAISNVLPGTYTVLFESEGFVGTQQEIVVRSGQVSTLDVLLAHLPSVQPYVQQIEFTGFVECSAAAVLYSVAACGLVNLVGGGNTTNDRFMFTWDVDPNLHQVVAEISWDPNTALGDRLSFSVEPLGIPNEGQTTYASGSGTGPLVLTADLTRIHEVDVNMTAICNGEKEPTSEIAPSSPEAYCRPPLFEEGGGMQARIFVSGFSGAPVPIGVAAQQEYHVLITMFHHAPACEDYSIFLSNECPQQAPQPDPDADEL